MQSESNERMYKVKEVAQRLRISQATVLRLIETGELRGVLRVGNQWRIPQSSLDDYVRRASQ
jgi:excisionase family DNA binding protein